MSRGLNKATLIGNVGQDPDIRSTQSGTRIAKFSLATNRTWKDGSGQQKEKTEWHRLVCFGKLVDVVEQYVKKGDRLYVEGRIEYSETEKDGVKRYWTDVIVSEMVMLGATDAKPIERSKWDDAPEPAETPIGEPKVTGGDYDDDLPFAPATLI